MEVNAIEILGLVAAGLTTVSFVPQLLRIIRTKNVEGISLAMYLVFFAGVLMWLTYGVLINSLAVTVANAVTALLVLAILVLRWRLK